MFTNYLHRKYQIQSSYSSLVIIMKQKAQYTSHIATIYCFTFHKTITLIKAKYFLRFINRLHFRTTQSENKMPTRCNRGFYRRSYCLLNMFRAPLCPSSGAQEYYTVVAACGISCCCFQVAGLVWS